MQFNRNRNRGGMYGFTGGSMDGLESPGPSPFNNTPQPMEDIRNPFANPTYTNRGANLDSFMDSPISENMPEWLRNMMIDEQMLPGSPPGMDENYEIASMGPALGGLLGQSLNSGMY